MKSLLMVIMVCILISLFCISCSAAPAQPEQNAVSSIGVYTPSLSKPTEGNSIFVHPQTGSDSSGTGSLSKPYKTITHALEMARSGDTVTLEPANVYSAETGELFPIHLKSGVKLTQKQVLTPAASPSKPAVIKGGARYEIPDSDVGRYVSVLGADGATVSGISFQVTNTPGAVSGTDDGTAIMCDGSSPTIRDNTFSGKGHAGITSMGTAHPSITKNNFTGDLSWGITTYEESYPAVVSNTFSSINGIDCSATSYPTIDKNKFSCKSTGVSVKSSSDATVTNNEIKANGEYGIMVRMDATPVIQGNTITQNPTGIYVAPGTPVPDIGGGGRSTGGNTFDNTNWNIEHRGSVDISAKNNHWKNNCCEDITAKIYDHSDSALSGTVDVGLCTICRVVASGAGVHPAT